jgi:hypothetical protein
MFCKKVTRVVVLTIVLVFMFSATAFSFDLQDAIKAAIYNVNKVIINNTEVPFIKHGGKIYVPVDTFALAGANVTQEQSILKVDNLYDAETAYEELTKIYNRHLERIKNPIPSNAKDAVNLHHERYKLVLAEIMRLDNMNIRYGATEFDIYLFLPKAHLHTSLINEMMVHACVYEAIANNNKLAKKDIKELESSIILYGNYAARAFKGMEDTYKKFKEAE